MAKINYSKSEEAFNEGLLKFDIDRLLEETDKEGLSVKIRMAKQILIAMHYDIKNLHKKGLQPYTHLGIDKDTIKTLLDHVQHLTPEEWEILKAIKKKLDAFKVEVEKEKPSLSNEAIVEEERRTQPNKRFNVNERWWPL